MLEHQRPLYAIHRVRTRPLLPAGMGKVALTGLEENRKTARRAGHALVYQTTIL